MSSDGQDGIAVRCGARFRLAGGLRRARRDTRSGRTTRARRVGIHGAECFPPVGDRPGTPPTVRCQCTMIEDEVDARTRRERGQAFQQFDGLEHQVRRAVAPLGFQAEEHPAIARFRFVVVETWCKWLQRRSWKARLTWDRFHALLARYSLPPARVIHSVYRPAATP